MRARWSLGLLSTLTLVTVTSCDRTAMTAPDVEGAAPAEATAAEAPGAPKEGAQLITLDVLNPCTDEVEEFTFDNRVLVHELPNGNVVVRFDRTITTESGFEGRGSQTLVRNGRVFKVQANDMLTHPSGAKLRAHVVSVLNLNTATVQTDQFSLTCIRG